MTEIYTPGRAEDAVADTTAFLETSRGLELDGAQAADYVDAHLSQVGERAKALLHAVPHPELGSQGLYLPLSKYNATSFDEAVAVLPGHLVLLPSTIIDKGTRVLYPAVVSEDGIKSGELRLHALRQPYHRAASYGAEVMLAAAGQSETKSIGEHGHSANVGIEAEHFSTLLSAAGDPVVHQAWRRGTHINHAWRDNPKNSVFSQVTGTLFSDNRPPATVTISRSDIEFGRAQILWDSALTIECSDEPLTAGKEKALVVYQSLAYHAMLGVNAQNPKGTVAGHKRRDAVMELLS